MWVGTWGGGICRFWDETWDLIDTGNSPLPDQIVWSGCVDNSGTVWLGTYRGLARYRNGSWDVFTMDNSDIPYNDISSLCSDRDDANAVWLGTWRGGIARFDGTHWTKFDSLNSKLPGNYVEALAYDSQNRLWIGSWGGGVAVYDGNGWVVFDSSNSELPSDNIRMLLDDPQNSRMWICSDGGLASYDYRSLSAAPGPTTAARNLRVVQISPNDLPTIDIALPRSSRTTVALFDIDGRRVATLAEGRMGRGTHTIPIPATTPNGFYNCVMSLDGKQVASTKVLLHR
jgi:ligand-binding sensor domain-containing protein